ncbi:MAG: TetR/AcrR family transcriptional regulator [Nitrospira sp.]|nr:TetR/AcrR family transcriptional regulator [Nitrospira sp.]
MKTGTRSAKPAAARRAAEPRAAAQPAARKAAAHHPPAAVPGAGASRRAAPPRRAPASAKSAQRVRDIVRTGRAVFAELGYERATVTEIAQRLGASEATVFTYFRGKRELCVRVIGDWYDEITAALLQGWPHARPPRAQLEYFVHAHLRLFLGHGSGMCALVLSEGRDKGVAELGAAVLPLHRRYTAALMDLLSRGQTAGTIRSDVPLRLLRSLVMGPMEQMLWEAVASQKPIDVDGAATALGAVLWTAIAAPGSELAALRRLRGRLAQALDDAASG